MKNIILLIVICIVCILLFCECTLDDTFQENTGEPTTSPIPDPTPTASPTLISTPTPTSSPIPTLTKSPIPTESPTPTPTESPTPTPTLGGSIVSQYGNLKVQYSEEYSSMTLCAENGSPVQLKGIGSMGLQWYPWTKGVTLKKLVNDWNIKITRAAMYIEEGGYKSQPDTMKQRVKDIVDDAIEEGIYVLIDWHILSDGNPKTNYSLAVDFFTEMSQTYGGYPNVLFDICNEPNGVDGTWQNIKDYATGWDGNTGILNIIQDNDPDDKDNIIVVGTPNWSQWVDKAELDPIVGYNNIMFAFHFYASSQYHDFYDSIEWEGYPALGLPEGNDGISRIAEEVLSRGNIALFVTEWGTCEETGNGNIDQADCDLYMGWMQSRNLSWVNWSLCTKNESASALNGDTDSSDKIGTWDDSTNLTTSGTYVKYNIMNEFGTSPPPTSSPTPTSEPTATPGSGGDCSNISTGGNSGNFNTTDVYCFKTQDSISGWGCSNFSGRTVSVTVNGSGTAVTSCGDSLPSKGTDDYYHFECSAGDLDYAAIYWW